MSVAEDIQDGHQCQTCGNWITDGEAAGYPRYCRDCGGIDEDNFATTPEIRRQFRAEDSRRKKRKRT